MSRMWNDEVNRLALRAKELANLPMPELRRHHPDCATEGSWRLIRADRGECIEAILLEEFQEEFDFEIGEEK